MIYLLVISFIFHFISIYLIVLLFQRQKKQDPKDHERELKELEDLLLSFTTEMKENNEKLIQSLSSMEKKPQGDLGGIKSKNENVQENSLLERDMGEKRNDKSSRLEDSKYDDYEPPVPEIEDSQVNPSTTAQVLSLHRKGYNVQEIAKALNVGAGEVELLIKFYK
ncbi:DUF6115 domain-containing protein [Evansella tamaricis]|uniref:Uncharacterized protein n=1 Tax=Evansella tamaricis TaxID=2069301 RepID=A0ABS6JME2_9BACI|nr:hypothetical protein [Evansella tamaricis]MBU9714525.1 hypothetical protein [Evansella tamaricis]